jgi:hypothetical protein
MRTFGIRPVRDTRAWQAAVSNKDDAALRKLADAEPPECALYELATAVNGMYQAEEWAKEHVGAAVDFHDTVVWLLPTIRKIRHRLSWRQQRELDVAVAHRVCRSGYLSVVIGAGVTQGAKGPSWVQLVERLLRRTLAASSPAAAERSEAAWILAKVMVEEEQTDNGTLMRGAELCQKLLQEKLAPEMMGIVYATARSPAESHREIAAIAKPRRLESPVRPFGSGWDAIITYNFDDLMSRALLEAGIAPVCRYLASDGVAEHATAPPQSVMAPAQPVLHLHGYAPPATPQPPSELVFAASQYQAAYAHRRELFDQVVDNHLANPVHVALYVGCSFKDEYMNQLLRAAAASYPGRHHYALMKWDGVDPDRLSADELEQHNERYVSMGVQPIWVTDYPENAPIIRRIGAA